MYTPGDLYRTYSENPCIDNIAAGAPYSLSEMTKFLKQVKYPCLHKAPGYNDLHDGSGEIALPYKFLEIFDPHLFSEVQPSIQDGVAHAIRNAADVSRACFLVEKNDLPDPITITTYHGKITKESLGLWEARGATEYLTFFGKNSIAKCLFALGPDLVSKNDAAGRGTGCDDMDCLPPWKKGQTISSLGGVFSCEDDEQGDRECTPCRKCPPEDDTDICCQPLSCADRANFCCNDPSGDGEEFIYNVPPNDDVFAKPKSDRVLGIINKKDFNIYHVGLLKRKQYGGYANLEDCSDQFYTGPKDLFLSYVQKSNGYNYEQNRSLNNGSIDRAKIISYVDNVDDVKKLIYNGYGVVLLSNIGFSRQKDSYGLSYPDRIWYHTYAVVGYDDTKKHFTECVYVLANSWGQWNYGGHPPWGKLPTGCFLVTETHMKGMLDLQRIDKAGCKDREELFLLADGERLVKIPGCTTDNDCIPWECDKKQTPLGMAFVICLDNVFKPKHLDYRKMINTAQDDYIYGQERNIFITGMNPDSIYYNNISGTLGIDSYFQKIFDIQNPYLVKNNNQYNTSNIDPNTYISKQELDKQNQILPNLQLNTKDKSVDSYIKNEIQHYGTLFDKYTATSDEATTIQSNVLKISGIIADHIHARYAYLESDFSCNSMESQSVNISGKSIVLDKTSPGLRASIINCEGFAMSGADLLMAPGIKGYSEDVWKTGERVPSIRNKLIINASTYVQITESSIHSGVTINCPFVVLSSGTNNGIINGQNIIFERGSVNASGGVVNGPAVFCSAFPQPDPAYARLESSPYLPLSKVFYTADGSEGSVNASGGIINSIAFFDSDSTNDGDINGTCIAEEKAEINGNVYGSTVRQDSIYATYGRSSPNGPPLTPRGFGLP